ncbi:MAG: hypothetical protein Phog2KO_39980 [Phototrophicaceae bacterium]
MSQISSADNHIIISSPERWRLIYNERPLAEAYAQGFRYSGRFGTTRRLPDGGLIQKQDIQQVVLGWQQTDESWHLGLILEPTLANERGSRWCELVYWPDPEITVFQDLAQTAGQELAQTLGVPFFVIPPQVVEQISPKRDLPALPLEFGYWQMESAKFDTQIGAKHSIGMDTSNQHLVIERKQAWKMRKFMRAAWYVLWSLAYLTLSLATIFGDIALPNTGTLLPSPEILPYLGILISIGLFVAALYQVYKALTSISTIYIDGDRNLISAWTGRKMHWLVSKVEIQSLYISEIAKKNEQAPATEYGELNLHLGGGTFHFVLQHQDPEDNADTPQPELMIPRIEAIRELDRNVIHTNLQIAGEYISEALDDVPIWYDLRIK